MGLNVDLAVSVKINLNRHFIRIYLHFSVSMPVITQRIDFVLYRPITSNDV